MTYSIQVVDRETLNVVHEVKLAGLHAAARVENGMNINLNHQKYFTRLSGPVSTASAEESERS